MRSHGRWIVGGIGMMALIGVTAWGWSSTSQVASKGRPVPASKAEESAWPEGILDLVNDPVRADGWNPWFSEWPNDVNHYEMIVQGGEDVQRLLDKLGKVRCKEVRLVLKPDPEPRSLGFTTVLTEGNQTAALFSIGSQPVIDWWYGHLHESEPGIRTFGVHRYQKCPEAMPPTLTLFVGHENIELAELRIPEKIVLQAAVPDAYREVHVACAAVQAIDRCIAKNRPSPVESPGTDADPAP